MIDIAILALTVVAIIFAAMQTYYARKQMKDNQAAIKAALEREAARAAAARTGLSVHVPTPEEISRFIYSAPDMRRHVEFQRELPSGRVARNLSSVLAGVEKYSLQVLLVVLVILQAIRVIAIQADGLWETLRRLFGQ